MNPPEFKTGDIVALKADLTRQGSVIGLLPPVASKAGRLVRERKWLPDKTGQFHAPSELRLSDLPDDFDKENWRAKQLAQKLGFKPEIDLSQFSEEQRKRFQFAETLSEDEMELVKAARKKKEEEHQKLNYADDYEHRFDRPQRGETEDYPLPGPVPDPERRREKKQADIQREKENDLPVEERVKKVLSRKWEPKNEEVY